MGENIYDMFDFIVSNYENLPEVICFVKADVIPRHCGEDKFAQIIHNKYYTPIENYSRTVSGYTYGAYAFVDGNDNYNENSNEINYVAGSVHRGRYFTNYKSFLDDIFENWEVGDYIKFPPGGCHLIPRTDILKYNKSFYEWLRNIVSYDVRPGEAFILERAIQTLFTCDWIIKDKYLNI